METMIHFQGGPRWNDRTTPDDGRTYVSSRDNPFEYEFTGTYDDLSVFMHFALRPDRLVLIQGGRL